jgi:hypothetical protein
VLVCGGYSRGPRELPGVGGPGLGEAGRYTALSASASGGAQQAESGR